MARSPLLAEMDDIDLYRTPADVLRRERDHLKARLKEERAELRQYADLAKEVNGEMAGLLESVTADVKATEALLAEYKRVIKAATR